MKPNTPTSGKSKNQNASRPELRGSLAHRMSTDPFLDWVIILSGALLITLALVGVGISVYLDTGASLTAESRVSKGQALPLDEAQLDAVLDEFNTRAERTGALLQGFNAPRDPSLP